MELNQRITKLALEIIAQSDQNAITLDFLEKSLTAFAAIILAKKNG